MKETNQTEQLLFVANVPSKPFATGRIVIKSDDLQFTDQQIKKSTAENERARNKSLDAAARMYTGS